MSDRRVRDATGDTVRRLSKLLEQRISAVEIKALLPKDAISYLSQNMHRLSDVSLIWQAMDDEWRRIGANFRSGNEDAIARFYELPVWLLNGLFTETDAESRLHRKAIADFVIGQDPDLVADYGGGFGSLGRRIALIDRSVRVVVVEPYPSGLATRLAQDITNLSYQPELPVEADVLIAQDVLEHVTDPLAHFARLLASVRIDGIVIAANCFRPVILCHYPGAFHFHFNFPWIAATLGCRFEGAAKEAPHALVFRRTRRAPNWLPARSLERLSRSLYPVLLAGQKLKRKLPEWVRPALDTDR